MWAGFISILAWALLETVAPGASIPWSPAMGEAASAMESALGGVAWHCRENGISVETGLDPNGTCLVGPELTDLFTSSGQLEAKRTTTTPDMAALLAHLLSEAGVEEGDRVGVGASGSFPALLVAALAAVEAVGAEPVTILSLGASSFGATRPAFHLLDLYGYLEAEGLAPGPPAAVSLGGSGDVGAEFDPAFRNDLLRELMAGDVPVLLTPDLRSNVAERMALYGFSAPGEGEAGVQAFVNIGGAEANLGVSHRILNVPPGLVEGIASLPPEQGRGVLFEMASRGVPVIHLLHVRGLALRYGLPWDPLPLPEAGATRFRDSQRGKGVAFWLLTMGYLGALAAVAISGGFRGRKTVR